MKHIPTLTLTALAAAASAQTAPAPAAKQELSYNRVIVSTVIGHSGLEDGFAVQAQAKLGHGFYVSASTVDLENQATEITTSEASLGYAYTLPTVAGISSDLNVELGADSLGVGIRALVGYGIEIGASYTAAEASELDVITVSASYSLAQFVKGLSVNVSHVTYSGDSPEATAVGLAYNF